MKSFAVKGVLALVLLYSVNATARITAVEEYNYNFKYTGNGDDEFVCESISGLHSNIPTGYNCTKVSVRGKTCYKNCTCSYTYTSSNCPNGTLGGGICEKNGTTYRETCTLCEYQYTSSNCTESLLAGDSCVRGDTTYRENCNCNYEFTSSNCNGVLSGGECMKNGTTYHTTCTPASSPSCTYTYTSSNCNGTVGGGTCEKDGTTYYELCNCTYEHTTSNCSAPAGQTCTKNGTTYYKNCNCNNYYTSDNCGQLTGSSCKKKNKLYYDGCNCGWDDDIHEYYTYTYGGEIYSNCDGQAGGSHCTYNDNGYTVDLYTTCTPCDNGDYPYTVANCVHPTGNTCTTPDRLDDDDDYRGGNTYYQSCNSPISINCNVGDWVYRYIGHYAYCYTGSILYEYYPGCEEDGYTTVFRKITDSYVNKKLKDMNYDAEHNDDNGLPPLPPFVCVSHSTSLTADDLAVWSGGANENAPLTYAVTVDEDYDGYTYQVTYYGGYKLTGIFIGNGKAVDITGWKGPGFEGVTMGTSAYSQWFGSLGVRYNYNSSPNYFEQVEYQGCNFPTASNISCATGESSGLINTLYNGSHKFSLRISDTYPPYYADVDAYIYPANLCLGKNLESLSGYTINDSNNGEYEGMVYYYLPSEEDWMAYHPLMTSTNIRNNFRQAFGGSNYGNDLEAMPLGSYSNADIGYWSSTCFRTNSGGQDFAWDCTTKPNVQYVMTRTFEKACGGAYQMLGDQKNGCQTYNYHTPMGNRSWSNRQGHNNNEAYIRTNCFINLSGYDTESN